MGNYKWSGSGLPRRIYWPEHVFTFNIILDFLNSREITSILVGLNMSKIRKMRTFGLYIPVMNIVDTHILNIPHKTLSHLAQV